MEKIFKENSKIDIILDDGGHTNTQQIITTENAIRNINDGRILIVEDICTIYINKFANPSKYSFINYSKKKLMK